LRVGLVGPIPFRFSLGGFENRNFWSHDQNSV
jgi:hypothetical protein